MAELTVLSKNDKTLLEMGLRAPLAVVRVAGVIDEDINFSVVAGMLKELGPSVQGIRFDLGEVTRMNSCGVREWLLLLERLPQAMKIIFSAVPEHFIEQANMIPNVFGRKTNHVETFFAPYHCSTCGRDQSCMLEPAGVTFSPTGDVLKAPALKCEKCGGILAFDWVEEEYFAFLKRVSHE